MANTNGASTMDVTVGTGSTTPNTVGVYYANPDHRYHGHVATDEHDHRQCICHGCTDDRMALVDGKD